MSKPRKTLEKIAAGQSDANIRFGDLLALLIHLGFAERIRGDHHIFTRTGVEAILNLQPRNGMAKPYQVKQVRAVLLAANLIPEDLRPPAQEPGDETTTDEGEDS